MATQASAYQAAPGEPQSRFAHIRAFIDAEIARRDAQSAASQSPSDYWKDYNRYSAYVRTLPDEELKSIRHHTWHLTGDRYDVYLSMRSDSLRYLIGLYESSLPRLGGFRPQEPADGLGIDTQYGRLNSGIVRYAVVVADLHSAGQLPRKGPLRFVELGGGYGGLALMCMQFNPDLSYVICDLEETLFFQGVFLSLHLGADKVKLIRGEGGELDNLQPGCVYLLPQSRAAALQSANFDLAINQQSMQEMTEDQVERYCELIAKCADKLYSCNKRQHGSTIVREKGLIKDLHGFLGRRFPILWDSTDDLGVLARLCIRHKWLRKAVTFVIGSSFLPAGEAALRRFIYRTRNPS
jgi:hypothetical protein